MALPTPHINRRPLIALMTASGISLLGTQLTVIAIPWFVLQTTGSAARAGITAFFSLLPLIIAGMLGGPLIDRFGFRRTSLLSDLASGVAVAAIPFLHHTVGLAFWQLLTLVFLRELANAPGRTARQGLTPDLIALSGFGRERVNSAFQFIFNIVGLLGAPLAGVLIALLNPSNVLWLDAATFLVSAAMMFTLVPHRVKAALVTPVARGYIAELAAGFRFLRQQTTLAAIVGIGTALNALGAACFGIILPVHISRSQGQAVDLGLLIAGLSGGTLLGTACYSLLSPRLPRRATFIATFFLGSLPLWVLVVNPPLWAMIAALACLGFVSAPGNPIVGTIMQERIPAELRGRVFGLTTALVALAAPLGVLVTGFAIERISTSAALAVVAVCYFLIAVGVALHPALRDLSPPPAGPDDDAPRQQAENERRGRLAELTSTR